MTADEEHGDETDVRQHVDAGQEVAPDGGRLERLPPDVVGLLGQLRRLHRLGAEPLDDAHAGDGLLDHRRQLGLLLLDGHDGRMDALREPAGEPVDQRQRQHGEHGQHGVQREQDGDAAPHHEERRDRERDHHDEGLDLQQIAARPAHQLTRLRTVVEADVQPHEVREQLLSQHRLGEAALAEGEVPARGGEDGDDHAGDHDQAGPHHERPEPLTIPRSMAIWVTFGTAILPAV
jgi:hypothetical protein